MRYDYVFISKYILLAHDDILGIVSFQAHQFLALHIRDRCLGIIDFEVTSRWKGDRSLSEPTVTYL